MTLFQIVSSGIQEGIAHTMEVMVALGSLQRVGSFLSQNAWTESRRVLGEDISEKASYRPASDSDKGEYDAVIRFDKVRAKLGDDSDQTPEVTFHVPPNGLTVLVGPTGSGKSTLLRLATGDLKPSSGTVVISDADIAVCNQTPWIANLSIRDNIIGASPFNAERYGMALQACALEHDIREIAGGDQHLCGLNGQSLSGGQKVRVVS
jgi:ABC-type bacteriocin/lantibiotic exporter with double-glycine peptidase domain